MISATSAPPRHAPGGRFRNPWPDSAPQGARDVLRVILEYRRRTRISPARQYSFPTATPKICQPHVRRTEATATWIGHSTVLLQLGGVNILTDPVFSQRAFPVQWFGPRRVMAPAMSLDELPPIDVVLLSHNHYDHLDRPAVKRISRAHPPCDMGCTATVGDIHPRLWRARGGRAGLVGAINDRFAACHGNAGAAYECAGHRRPKQVAMVRVRARTGGIARVLRG